MRGELKALRSRDPRINYRGASASRLDNLTDAVFGIAITLLIFNLIDANSFDDLLIFTKTLPAFIISISFILLIWNEHVRFSEIYTLGDTRVKILNTFFIALVIFYVYPLRFLTLMLTSIFFDDITVGIRGEQVPSLMIYYGCVVVGLYVLLFLFYFRAFRLRESLELNSFEIFFTRSQMAKQIIMFAVPAVSIVLILILRPFSASLASLVGGMAYGLYPPAIIFWARKFRRRAASFAG